MVLRKPVDIGATMAASTLLDQDPHRSAQPESDCQLLKFALQDGIDLIVWKGHFEHPTVFDIHDDIHRISFSCALSGSSQSRFDDGAADIPHLLRKGEGSISFNPGRRGTFTQAGSFESLIVMVRPDVFSAWAEEPETASLRGGIEAGRYQGHCTCSAELCATAQTVSRTLCAMHACPGGGTERPPLWLLGQSLVMISLILEAHDGPTYRPSKISWQDQQRLLRARDRLLDDLSRAPTLPELAREADLSMLKLKRGFRQLFNNSVYGLFQQERMHEARRRLGMDIPVLTIAADLGYTNASHFAAAFKKQFGVNPSAIRRRR